MHSVFVRRWLAAAVIAAFLWPALGIATARASAVDGTWIIEDLILNLFDCKNQVCGRILWIKDPKRRPAQCGMTIVWALTPDGPGKWSEGYILDPDIDTTYRLAATLEPDGTIHARIYKGIPLIGQTKILHRVDLKNFEGKC